MYLARTIAWKGKTPHMVGAIAGDIVMHDKPVGRGYVKLKPTADHPWPREPAVGDEIRCHEFHYSSIDNLPADTRYAYDVSAAMASTGNATASCYKNLLASYTHLRSTAAHDWAARFVAFIRQCMGGRSAVASAAQPRAA